MALQKSVTVAGSSVTPFLVVAAVVNEAVTAVMGADVGPGIVGVAVGALAAIAVPYSVNRSWSGQTLAGRWALTGYAMLGLVLVLLAGWSYVNVPGADEYRSRPLSLVITTCVGLVVAVGGWRRDLRSPAR